MSEVESRLTIAAAGWCLTESDSQASLLLPRLLGKQGATPDKEPYRYNGGLTVIFVVRVLTVLKRGLICSEGSSISPAAGLLPTVSCFMPVDVQRRPGWVTYQ